MYTSLMKSTKLYIVVSTYIKGIYTSVVGAKLEELVVSTSYIKGIYTTFASVIVFGQLYLPTIFKVYTPFGS